MRHWPQFVFDPSYSEQDELLVGTAANKIALDVYNMMRPFTDENAMYKDLKIEFVPEQNLELRKHGALGLAWKNRNINCVPKGLGRWGITAYSGIISMELTHSVIMRLVNHKTGNDLIHWLYNEGHLLKIPYVRQWNIKHFGGSLTLVVPDMVYGWQHQNEIMDGIRSGKYKESRHEYWSDPAWKGDIEQPVAATRHELETIEQYLKSSHPYSV